MLPQIDIAVDEGVSTNEPHLAQLAESAVAHAFTLGNFEIPEDAELSIMLAHNSLLQELNKQWRNKDKPTNVLSFPTSDISIGDMPEPILGDIVISLEMVAYEANLENKTFDDHFSHLVVHGLLHLFGYDHETDTEANQMESLETKILAEIGIADPYESE